MLATAPLRPRNQMNQAHDTLANVFGFSRFRPGQQQVIGHLLEGNSAVAIFPTGSGKSLCYQLPALVFEGLTVVISPLIALMKDQIDFLRERNIAAARLDSTLERDDAAKVYENLRAGRTRLLFVSPERLGNERFLQLLDRQKISLLAVDEAHCISEWGHNFRPDYLRIASLAQRLQVERVLALTATATPSVVSDIARAFHVAPECVVQTGFYRPNLELRVTACTDRDRKNVLLKKFIEHRTRPAIVYVTLQRTAEEVAEFLASHGINARAYHAGLKPEQRETLQDEFMKSNDMIVVATIAFGMGIDKSNIRGVYHFNLPKSLESYMQEIGRAGRDGEPAVCEMLACRDDLVTLENFSYGDTPTTEAIRGLVADLLSDEDTLEVSIYELSAKHDARELAIKTLLTYLELQGILQSTGPIYSEFKFRPLRPSSEILAKFDSSRAAFLQRVFQSSHKKGKSWCTIDVASTANRLEESRDRIVSALDFLDQSGDIELQSAGLRYGYRVLDRSRKLPEIVSDLVERFARREEQDIQRLRKVVALAECGGCYTRFLLEYFGERRANCGHCSRCAGTPKQILPTGEHTHITEADRAAIRQLLSQRSPALVQSRQLARFLCGITSPATTKAKLRQHDDFGRLDRMPFSDVLAGVENVAGLR